MEGHTLDFHPEDGSRAPFPKGFSLGFVLKPSNLARQEKMRIGPSLCEAPRELNEAAVDSKGP